jgi:hypothetical protein
LAEFEKGGAVGTNSGEERRRQRFCAGWSPEREWSNAVGSGGKEARFVAARVHRREGKQEKEGRVTTGL